VGRWRQTIPGRRDYVTAGGAPRVGSAGLRGTVSIAPPRTTQGKVLAGRSSINAQPFTRGPRPTHQLVADAVILAETA
jgi:hypothetical protein